MLHILYQKTTQSLVIILLLLGLHPKAALSLSSGQITTIAGTGEAGFSSDNVPATSARLNLPRDITVSGNDIYIVDSANNRLRKIDSSLKIFTITDTQGRLGFSGDSGPATSAKIWSPSSFFLKGGNLYFTDSMNRRLRKIDTNKIITTIGGNGENAYFGDSTPATLAGMKNPYGVCVDKSDTIYVSDRNSHVVRKINTSTGIITTIAGTGTAGFSGDGGPATLAKLYQPSGLAIDSDGNLYIADSGNHRIRKINAIGGIITANSIITTVAGKGTYGFSGDGGPATSAQLYFPYDVACDSQRNIYIADTYNSRIRKVLSENGVIATIAGTGATSGDIGDEGPAITARLNAPLGLFVDTDIYIADSSHHRIRKIKGLGPSIYSLAKTSPLDGADTVLIDQKIIVTFSQPMNTSTVTYSCSPDPGGWTVSWNAACSEATYAHNPFAELISYAFAISSGKTAYGLEIFPGVLKFKTIGVPPAILLTTPSNLATGVGLTQDVVILFSEAVDTATDTYSCSPDPGGWTASWNAACSEVTYTHNDFSDTYYTFKIISVKDSSGNSLVSSTTPNPFSFTPLSSFPTVISLSPLSGTTKVSLSETMTVCFLEPMDTQTVIYSCSPDPGGWAASWNAANTEAAYSHNNFDEDRSYTFKITGGQDSLGSPLTKPPYTTTFSTAILPFPPRYLNAQEVSASRIDLTWEDVSFNESGFKLEKKTGDLGTYTQIALIAADSETYSDTDVVSDTTSYYRLRAYNGAGDSNYSNEAMVVTPPSGTMVVTPSDVCGEPGETIRIPILLSGSSSDIKSFQFTFNYDTSALIFCDNALLTPLTSKCYVYGVYESDSGQVVAGWSMSLPDTKTGSVDGRIPAGSIGSIIDLVFKVAACDICTPVCDTCPACETCVEGDTFSFFLSNLKDGIKGADTPSGIFTFRYRHDGDVNLDGKIGPGDASLAFQISLGMKIGTPPMPPTSQQRGHADRNNDGDVTPEDAMIILKEYLTWK